MNENVSKVDENVSEVTEKVSKMNENVPKINVAKSNGNNVNVRKTRWHKLKCCLKEYCEHSTIQGLQYFAQNISIWERLWWTIVLTASVIGCVYTTVELYQKWMESPVIVIFSTKEIPIRDIPFPAVTICPEAKISTTYFNHTDVLRRIRLNETIDEAERKQFDYMNLLCDINYTEIEIKEPDVSAKYDALDIHNFFYEHKSKYNYTFWWLGYESASYENVKMVPIMTDGGLCYTFNMLDRDEIYSDNVIHYRDFLRNQKSEWNLETGYTNYTDLVAYPRRILGAGAYNSFVFLLLTPREDEIYSCDLMDYQGFRDILLPGLDRVKELLKVNTFSSSLTRPIPEEVYPVLTLTVKAFVINRKHHMSKFINQVSLHSPYRIPLTFEDYFSVSQNRSVIANIEPEMITTSEAVKRYHPNVRRCYFANERKLKYFKMYSAMNCLIECRTNYTLEQCGCVDIYMPRISNHTPICGSSFCVTSTKIFEEPALLANVEEQCDCKPLCTDITYKYHLSQADLDLMRNFKAVFNRENLSEIQSLDVASVQIFFKARQFIPIRKDELYSTFSFIANVGGILGLFIGFSLFSLAEIIYFMTIRLIAPR